MPRRTGRWGVELLRRGWATAWLLAVAVAPATGLVVPQGGDGDGLSALVVSSARLAPSLEIVSVTELSGALAPETRAAWSRFEVAQRSRGSWGANVDRRSGLVELAEGAGVPWIPGSGNDLRAADLAEHLGGRSEPDLATLERIARAFLPEVAPLLGVEGRTLELAPGASGRHSDQLWFVELRLRQDGLPIVGSRVVFRVSHGNLVQFGAARVPAPGVPTPPRILDRDAALDLLETYVGGFDPDRDRFSETGTELLLPALPVDAGSDFAVGEGYDLVRVWEFAFERDGARPRWRARVDATTGEILELRDRNEYSQVTGGAWPISWRVGGPGNEVAQSSFGWPFVDVSPTGGVSNTSGIYLWDQTAQTALHEGPYVVIDDQCAGAPGTAASDGTTGNIDFGLFDPNANGDANGDCTAGQNGILDNSPAARQQYWHLNKIMEKGRSYLPANPWLYQQLTAVVNVNDVCNAYWDGANVNFFRSGSGCGNTGEDAGVSMHEWGHGLDSNDGSSPTADNGTGETYGDITAALQTRASCVGWGFRLSGSNCGGYGNPCSACDGVRDIDWRMHGNVAPWTVEGFTRTNCPNTCPGTSCGYIGPCGLTNGATTNPTSEGHCESYVSSGAVYDLAAYDLQLGCSVGAQAPGIDEDYNCGSNPIQDGGSPGTGGPYGAAAAWQTVDRLWYLSRPTADQAFTCSAGSVPWTSHGCNLGSNFTTFRVVDDDDGNLANGTPHSCMIAAAFDRHGIACKPPTAGSDAGWNACHRACTPPGAPTLSTPTTTNNRVQLAWSGSGGVFDVYRNEIGCGSGFTKIADDVVATSYEDADVANGTAYYYQIVEHPAGTPSCASVPSGCETATPSATASAVYVPDSAVISSVPTDNDGDGFVDNCETGQVSFDVYNDGSVDLDNVTLAVASLDAAATVTTQPTGVPSLLKFGTVTRTFELTLDGALCAQSIAFQVTIGADQMGGTNVDTMEPLGPFEQSYVAGNHLHDFESDEEGWTLVGFTRDTGIGAGGTSVSLHSSAATDGACDKAISPRFRPNGASSVSFSLRYDIEPRSQGKWWDKANVHAVHVATGTHTLLTPSSGVGYNAGASSSTLCHLTTQAGWAARNLSWPAFGTASFDLSGLTPGDEYELEVNYNTDGAVALSGFWFDEVAWTSVDLLGCDQQSDACTGCTPPDVPTGVVATPGSPGEIQVTWSALALQPDEYRIYRATAMGGPYVQVGTVPGSQTSFDDGGLTGGVTYWYEVTAFTTCESAFSSPASAVAPDCSTPTAVVDLAAEATAPETITLTWTTTGADSYDVLRSTTQGSGHVFVGSTTSGSYVDAGLDPGTTYWYLVVAHDDPDCDAAPSNEAGADAYGDCTTPPIFQAGSVTATAIASICGIRVEWPLADRFCGDGPVVYNVYRSTSPGFTADGSTLVESCVTGTAWDDTDPVLASMPTTYYYQVEAEDAEAGGSGPCQGGNASAGPGEANETLGTGTTYVYRGAPTNAAEGFESYADGSLGGWVTFANTSVHGPGAKDSWIGVRSCAAHTGTKVFRTGSGSNACTTEYQKATDAIAYPDPLGAGGAGVRIPGTATGTTLRFWHTWAFAANDWGSLYLSSDLSTTFLQIGDEYLSGTIYTDTGNDWFTGTQGTMSQTVVDLAGMCNANVAELGGNDCAGRDLQIGFRAFDDNANPQGLGWSLDDVEVTIGSGASCVGAPPRLEAFTATSRDGAVDLEWASPNDAACATVVVRSSTTDYPTSPAGGSPAVSQGCSPGGVGAQRLAVANDQDLFLSAFVLDGSANPSGRLTARARAQDATGDWQWAYHTGASAVAPPGIGSVFPVSNDRIAHALLAGADATTCGGGSPGSGCWPIGFEPQNLDSAVQDRPPVVPITVGSATKVAYVGTWDGYVVAVDGNTGALVWTSDDDLGLGGDQSFGAPVLAAPGGIFDDFGVTENLVFAGTRDPSGSAMKAVDADTGEIVWTFDAGGTMGIVTAAPYVRYDTTPKQLLWTTRRNLGVNERTVWCLEFDASSVLGPCPGWNGELGRPHGDIETAPAVDFPANTAVYVGTMTGEVRAIRLTESAPGANDGGLLIRSRQLGSGPVKGYVSPIGGAAYATTTAQVTRLTPDAGSGFDVTWSVSITGASAAVVSPAGRLYVGSSDGHLYELSNLGDPAPTKRCVDFGNGTSVGSPTVDVLAGMVVAGDEAGFVHSVVTPFTGPICP